MRCVSTLSLLASSYASPPSKIVFVLADDLGWGDVGFHGDGSEESNTPTMDRLVEEGIELGRHYVHYFCTPSRASLQSGRLPVHLLLTLPGPCDTSGAIPEAMTGLGRKLKSAGYSTHQVGKWDAGMVTPRHTPHGRGYDRSLGYFGHGIWGWTQKEWGGSTVNRTTFPDISESNTDLWDTDSPSKENGTKHAEEIFLPRVLDALLNNSKVFVQYSSKLPHYPLQTPPPSSPPRGLGERFLVEDQQENARVYKEMVRYLDSQLSAIVDALSGDWNESLIVFASDNGGFVDAADGPCNFTTTAQIQNREVGHGTACFNGQMGASNYPLRGGKGERWEGGVRSVAFVSGGRAPRRGVKVDDMIHIADWYATLSILVGVDPNDDALPAVDSIDAWPALTGKAGAEKRTSFLIDEFSYMSGRWKYIAANVTTSGYALGGPDYPNTTSPTDPISSHSARCGLSGCLFDVVNDPREIEDRIEDESPELVARLVAEMAREVETIYTVDHSDDPACYSAATNLYRGYYGPWINLTR